MDFSVIFNQVSTLLLLLLAGFIAKKVGIINDAVNKKLSELLLMVTSPMLIFTSFLMEYEEEKLVNAFYIIALGTVMFIISIFAAEKIFFTKQPEGKRAVIKSAMVFSNCGFMGFPLVDSIFGQEGVFYASIYLVVFNIVVWTYGVMVFSGKANFNIKKMLLTPAMVAVYLGITVFLFQINIPFPIKNAAQMTGNMTTPLSMIIIGAIIESANLKDALSDIQVYILSIMRLLFMPLLAYFLVMFIDIPKIASDICIVVLAMPMSVNAAVFAEKFETEPLFVSKVVTVSTLLSMLTIPIILRLL